MRNHYIELFKYNDWANQKLLICLQKNKVSSEKILSLYYHLIISQDIWLNRIENISSDDISLWETKSLLDLIDMSNKSADRWLSFLENYQMNSLDEVIAYTNTKGVDYENKLVEILSHVTNHSTHHRAQISLLLRNDDIEPPATDYIFYNRDKK